MHLRVWLHPVELRVLEVTYSWGATYAASTLKNAFAIPGAVVIKGGWMGAKVTESVVITKPEKLMRKEVAVVMRRCGMSCEDMLTKVMKDLETDFRTCREERRRTGEKVEAMEPIGTICVTWYGSLCYSYLYCWSTVGVQKWCRTIKNWPSAWESE